MAKELPYFKFEPAEYLTKNISFCSLSAQGLFVNICSYYWQRNCKLTTEQVLKRLNYKKELDELISEGIIDLQEDFIVIKFLDNQLVEVEKTSKQNSINGAKGGRPKKQTESENKPTALIPLSETKGIREDKIREDKIREDKIKENINTPLAFSFYNSLIDYGFNKDLVSEWLKVRKNKKLTNTKTAFNNFIKEVEKTNNDKNKVIEECIVKSWGGFKAEWINKEVTQNKLPKRIIS